MLSFFTNLFNNGDSRFLRTCQPQLKAINALADRYANCDADELLRHMSTLRQRAQEEDLQKLLPETFALVREAGKRALGLRHYDVQLIGGMCLFAGNIAEMRTGEGKTLVATLPASLSALSGKGVHLVTVNDYLAQRDAEWMRPLYEQLGLSVGVVIAGMSHEQRRTAYAADITYGTNSEFGFDYLRDHMAMREEERMQRTLHYAIVDEVDSILIDEARTPLIISGALKDEAHLYKAMYSITKHLTEQPHVEFSTLKNMPEETGDFSIDEKHNQVHMTDTGHEKLELLLKKHGLLEQNGDLYAAHTVHLMHHAMTALRARHLFKKNVHYLVQDGQVVIIDEHTGRAMSGRRWGDGLHQSVEAKEGVAIQQESKTMASISYQNYFRLYGTLAGMTGTARTEAKEFEHIYGLGTITIPTHQAVKRRDLNDKIYLTKQAKYQAVIAEIQQQCAANRPVLVGTASVETSELLSGLLQKTGIKHNVLNAKVHDKEAHIIAEAGVAQAVTIATNMAGRGTDIVLGGSLATYQANAVDEADAQQKWQQAHDAVVAGGGLCIIGSERHESRRIDNQLRGRSGRQGDPGSSQFFLSLEDEIIRLFAPERIIRMMNNMGLDDDEVIEHKLINRAIEKAQRKVEERNFEARKQLLSYDDVTNEQRVSIYKYRDDLLTSSRITENIEIIQHELLETLLQRYIDADVPVDSWDIAGLERVLRETFACDIPLHMRVENNQDMRIHTLIKEIEPHISEKRTSVTAKVPHNVAEEIQKYYLLHSLDVHWRQHLTTLEQLRHTIHLRGYGQKNPQQEFKRESFVLFSSMMDNVYQNFFGHFTHLTIEPNVPETTHTEENIELSYNTDGKNNQKQADNQTKKVGRNDPCHCGSGKKYKHCHGRA